MKITTKVISGYIILLLLITITIGIVNYMVKDLSGIVNNLSTFSIPMQTRAQDLALQFSKQAAGVRGYIATGNLKYLQDYELANKKAIEDEDFLKSKVNSGTKEKLDSVLITVNKYSQLSERSRKIKSSH